LGLVRAASKASAVGPPWPWRFERPAVLQHPPAFARAAFDVGLHSATKLGADVAFVECRGVVRVLGPARTDRFRFWEFAQLALLSGLRVRFFCGATAGAAAVVWMISDITTFS